MTACAYCGRDNEAGAQFCMDCGKPLGKSTGIKAAAAVSSARAVAAPGPAAPPRDATACPFCGARTSAALPFCAQCGRRLTAPGSGPSCARCASPVTPGTRFCPTCGAPLGEARQAAAHRAAGLMRICPVCSTKYRDDVKVCPSDGQTLRAAAPATDLVLCP